MATAGRRMLREPSPSPVVTAAPVPLTMFRDGATSRATMPWERRRLLVSASGRYCSATLSWGVTREFQCVAPPVGVRRSSGPVEAGAGAPPVRDDDGDDDDDDD